MAARTHVSLPRTMSVLLATAIVLLGLTPSLVRAGFTVQNFDTPGTPFTLLNGQTSILGGGPSGNFARLVQAVGGQTGALWFDRSQVGGLPKIIVDFDFRMSIGSRADGIGVLLANTASFGNSGAPLFFSEEPNVVNSLGVGFDIFNNGGPSEPSNNHVSLHWNGALVAVADLNAAPFNGTYQLWRNAEPNFFDHAQIEFDFITGGVNATVKLTDGSNSNVLTVFNNQFIAGVNPYESRLAFSGRTGGANANHDIDNVNAQFLSPVPAPAGFLLALVGGLGLGGASWWRKRRAS
jgi:hypothetical protein